MKNEGKQKQKHGEKKEKKEKKRNHFL